MEAKAEDVVISVNSALSPMVQATFDQLIGREPRLKPRGTKGMTVNVEAALVREDRQVHLVLRLGANAFSVMQFSASDPLMQTLDGMFTDFGLNRQAAHEAGQAERNRRVAAGELPPGYQRAGETARPKIPVYDK